MSKETPPEEKKRLRLEDLDEASLKRIKKILSQETIEGKPVIVLIKDPRREEQLRDAIEQIDFDSIFGTDAAYARGYVGDVLKYIESPVTLDTLVKHEFSTPYTEDLKYKRDRGDITEEEYRLGLWIRRIGFQRDQAAGRVLNTRRDWERDILRRYRSDKTIYDALRLFLKSNKAAASKMSRVLTTIEVLHDCERFEFPESILEKVKYIKEQIKDRSIRTLDAIGRVIRTETQPSNYDKLRIEEKIELVERVDKLARATIDHICTYKPERK